MRTTVNIALFLLGSLLWVGCSSTIDNEPIPDYILPEEKMKKVMTDVLLIEGARTGNKILGDTTTLASYYHLVWEKYDITEADFDTSFSWYTHHPKLASKIYGEIIIDLQKLEVDIQKKVEADTPEDLKKQVREAVTNSLDERKEKSLEQSPLKGEK